MSTTAIIRHCAHCKRTYTYNPSTGDFGLVCKHCHKPQSFSPAAGHHAGKSCFNGGNTIKFNKGR